MKFIDVFYIQITYETGMGAGVALSQLSANSQPKRGQNRNKRAQGTPSFKRKVDKEEMQGQVTETK